MQNSGLCAHSMIHCVFYKGLQNQLQRFVRVQLLVQFIYFLKLVSKAHMLYGNIMAGDLQFVSNQDIFHSLIQGYPIKGRQVVDKGTDLSITSPDSQRSDG